MPIKSEKKTDLQKKIAQAFTNAKNKGAQDNVNPNAVIQTLAREIADAIETYATSLKVTVTVNAGQAVAGGITTTPGSGQS